jgi:hypothetical protein
MRLTFFNSIRALFPVWSFFDRSSRPYELLVKVDSTWIPYEFNHRTKTHHLFFNPRGVRLLLEQSLLELFAQDVEECDPAHIPKLVSFQLISNMAEGRHWRVIRQRAVVHEESA